MILSRVRRKTGIFCSQCGELLSTAFGLDDPVVCNVTEHFLIEEIKDPELKKKYLEEIKNWSWD